MRIVHVHHHYLPIAGGMEAAVRALAEEQARRGHEVHVITSGYGVGGRPREEVVNGVHVHRVRAIRLGFPDLTVPIELPEDVIDRADVLHAHSQNSYFSLRVAEEARRRGVPVAFHLMALDALGDHPNPLVRLLGPAYASRAARRAIEVASVAMVKSGWDLERARALGADPVLVPDGVSDVLLSLPRDPEAGRELTGLSEPYFAYVGRLHRLKGVDVLVRALAEARRMGAEVGVAIAGPGDPAPYLRLAERLGVAGHVRFLGYVSEEQKAHLIDGAVALVVPSVSNYVEAYSIAASEAWARGRPVIASAVGALRYRVRDGVNGLLVPPRDPRALASAMVRLAASPEEADRMGGAGRPEALSWSQVYEMAMEAYRRALGEAAGR